MQVDALAVRLRPRTPTEASDLGVRLCQHAARSVFPCYALVAVPVIALALSSFEIAAWLPTLIIWWSKPWLDRTILFVLSRAAFGQRTTVGDLWRAQRDVWWRQFVFTLTIRRLSPWRSLTQPVYQLEGLSTFGAGARVRQIRQKTAGAAFMMTHAFSMAESAVLFGLLSLLFWLAPQGMAPDFLQLMSGEGSTFLMTAMPVGYALAILIVEPFYVAGGFAMYLNRRAELEAWDIEQEFRRAFGR
ncbi:MAG TPA: hypothetical protein VGJ52_07205 [Vicinamibacterales bacterium]